MEGLRPADSVSAEAPGKINISFRVGTPRDDGSRGLATLYQAVSLYDTVTVSADSSFKVTQLGLTGFGKVSPPERNLALKAAKLLAREFNIAEPVRIDVDKQIPKGAGMSGGSADAAAALVACNKFWGLNLPTSELKEIALQLGPDVSFALEGGTAVGTGHGDEFSPALSTGVYHWLVAPIGPRIDEDEVLSVLDEHRHQNRMFIGSVEKNPQVNIDTLHAIRSGDPIQLAETLHNDIQAASYKISADLARVCDAAEKIGALGCVMLAMGPATAFLMSDYESAEISRQLFQEKGHHVVQVHGPVPGARLI